MPPKKKKGDDEDDFTANSHDDFMATVQASREAQDAAAKRLEEAYYTQIKIAKEKVAKLKELENTHQKNETDLIDAQKKLAEYEAKLKALESEKETLTSTLKQVREDAIRREAEDRRKLAEADAAIHERNILKTEKARLDAEVAELRARTSALDKENIQHQIDAERARGEARALQERVNALQLELETMRELAKNQGPKEDADTIKRLSSELNSARELQSRTERQLLAAEKAKIEADTELKYKTARVKELEEDNKRFKEEIVDLRAQLAAASEKWEGRELHAAPAPASVNNSMLSESMVLDLTQRKDDAQAQLMLAREQLAEARAEIRHLREQLEEAKLKAVVAPPVTVKSRALGDLDGDEDEDARARMIQKELLEAVRKQVAMAEVELDAGLAELAAKDEEWTALHLRLRVADSKIAGFTEQVKSLTEERSHIEAERAQLKSELEKLREELARLTARMAHDETRRAEIEALADERAREITRLHELLKLRSEQQPVPVPTVVASRGLDLEEEEQPPAAQPSEEVDIEEVEIEIVDDDDDEYGLDLNDQYDDESSYDEDDVDVVDGDGFYRVDDDDLVDDDNDYRYEPRSRAMYSTTPLGRPHPQPRPLVYYGDSAAVTLPVILRPSQAATRLGLVGKGILHISREGVAFAKGGETVRWPLRVIKKYGDDQRLFSIEVGSIAATGKGVFFFETDRWLEAFRALNNQMIAISREFGVSSR